jgi:hypothetical protein
MDEITPSDCAVIGTGMKPERDRACGRIVVRFVPEIMAQTGAGKKARLRVLA